MSEAEKLEEFKDLYIGKHEEEYGVFLRSHFSKETCDQYWRKVFQNKDLDGLSISFHIKRYLACGFGIKELCSLLPAEPNEQDSAKIIQLVLDTDIYAQDTDCEKLMGISPDLGIVVVPFDGEISTGAEMKHAGGVSSPDGMELLTHIGVDTVAMNGDGFECFVQEGQQVKAGEQLVAFDRDKIAQAGHPNCVVVFVTNADDDENLSIQTGACKYMDKVISCN